MSGADPHEEPEDIATVRGYMFLVGGRGFGRRAEPARNVLGQNDVDMTAVRDALAILGLKLLPWQQAVLDASMTVRRLSDALVDAGVLPEPAPADPRARALWAKKHQGKGPPSPTGWRGRERSIKYKSR